MRNALIGLLILVWVTAHGVRPSLDIESQVRIDGASQPWAHPLVGKRPGVKFERRANPARSGSGKSPAAVLYRLDLGLRPVSSPSLVLPSAALCRTALQARPIHARAPPPPA